jgi:hypothetical protein
MREGQTHRRAVTLLALPTTLAIGVCSCGNGASGGAVELSWKLRPASGALPNGNVPFIDCDSGEPDTGVVADIELQWTVGDETSSPDPFWSCNDGHGVTGFDLPVGTALLSVAPVCEDGSVADPSTYTAPAPIERDVAVGDTISLGAVELVLQVSSCDHQACICHPFGSASSP